MTGQQQGRAREVLAETYADCGCGIPAPFDEVAEHAVTQALTFAAAERQVGYAEGVEAGVRIQPIDTALVDTDVIVHVGAMTFHAVLTTDGWQAAHEGEHPAAWVGGYAPDADEQPSMQPWGWRVAEDGHAG